MNYEILEDDRLRIYLEEGDLEVLEQFAKDQCESFDSDNSMYEVFEHLLCNSELQWSSPELIGALTSAPILCICEQGEEELDDEDRVLQAWAFMDYQVRSPQQDLLDYGECFWQCGWKTEE
jgi:hypothetical protein